MTLDALFQQSRDFSSLYVFGAGGSGREVAWLARQCWADRVRVVHLVDRPEYVSGPVNGHPVQLVQDVVAAPDARFIVAVGDSAFRRAAVAACEAVGLRPTHVVHPRVEASPFVDVAPGVLIAAGSVLTTNIGIGRHAHINIGCTVSHDVVIGEFATLSPGVHLSGTVHIGRDVFVGTGATVIHGRAGAPLVIGDGAVVAAGASVTKSVDAGALVAGVPAVRKR
jgi:sugar O-acyltransferase (sialic acid O-acetyltransferase NeuD family)